MKCTECTDYKTCRKAYDLRIKRKRCEKAKRKYAPTNADRIRDLSVEEMAELFPKCPPGRRDATWSCDGFANCPACWLDWLKSPAEVNE